jgi:hypothetical protein
MNEVNALCEEPFVEYESPCSSGNSSVSDSPSAGCRARELLNKPMAHAKGFHVAKRPKKFAPLFTVGLIVPLR